MKLKILESGFFFYQEFDESGDPEKHFHALLSLAKEGIAKGKVCTFFFNNKKKSNHYFSNILPLSLFSLLVFHKLLAFLISSNFTSSIYVYTQHMQLLTDEA